MQHDDEILKVICYVGADGVTVLRCPKCEAAKTIDTSNKGYAFKTFKASCRCGASIRGQFEFRRYYRKAVNLEGTYRRRDNGVKGRVVVEDLSLTGVGFKCMRKHDFQPGDQLDLTFNLDNRNRSEVKLWVEVTHLKDRFVGTRRVDTHLAQPELGFYLK